MLCVRVLSTCILWGCTVIVLYVVLQTLCVVLQTYIPHTHPAHTLTHTHTHTQHTHTHSHCETSHVYHNSIVYQTCIARVLCVALQRACTSRAHTCTLSHTHTHTRAHTHTYSHARTHAHTHTHTPLKDTCMHMAHNHAYNQEVLQHTATHCNTLQHTAAHCSTLQRTATLQHTATHCNTLQHAATHCNTLQHTAAHFNTLQHTATHCTTLSIPCHPLITTMHTKPSACHAYSRFTRPTHG